MDNFNEIFDVSKLSDTDLGHIEYVLASPSWDQVFRPYMTRMRDSMIKLWLDPREERKQKFSDEYLRSGINFIEGYLTFFDNIVFQTQHERVVKARQERATGDEYLDLQLAGKTGPPGTTKLIQDAEYPEGEEF